MAGASSPLPRVVATASGLTFAWGLTAWAVAWILDTIRPPKGVAMLFLPLVWLGVVWMAGRAAYRAAGHPWLCASVTTLAYVAGVGLGIAVDVHRHAPDAHHWPLFILTAAVFAMLASLFGAWAGRALARASVE